MFTLTKILSLFVYPLSLGLFFVGLSLWGQYAEIEPLRASTPFWR